jgi:hypothetical protein
MDVVVIRAVSSVKAATNATLGSGSAFIMITFPVG